MADIPALQAAIKKLHGCESRHVQSVAVLEKFKGQTVWDGAVEVFDLIGHAKATQCFAWAHDVGKKPRYIAVIAVPPIDSPQKAVQAAIASDFKNAHQI